MWLLDTRTKAGRSSEHLFKQYTGFYPAHKNKRSNFRHIDARCKQINCYNHLGICFIFKTLDHFRKGDVLVLQNEISELEYILSTGKEKGMKVVLNPSPIDEKLLKMPLEKADILILNEVEAGRILGKEVFDGEKTAEELAGKFPETEWTVLHISARFYT